MSAGTDKNVRQKGSTLSNFIGKAKSKVKLFNHSDNFSDNSSKQNGRTSTKPAEKSNEGPFAKVRNMVNNKSSNSSSTVKRTGAKIATATTKKYQVDFF